MGFYLFNQFQRNDLTTKKKKNLCLVQKYNDHTRKFKQTFLPKTKLQLQSENSKMDTQNSYMDQINRHLLFKYQRNFHS